MREAKRRERGHAPVRLLTGVALALGVAAAWPAGSARAADPCGGLADKVTHGEIVWSERAILVQGTAAPSLEDKDEPVAAIKRKTQRAALIDAYRRAAELLSGAKLTSTSYGGEFPAVVQKVQGFVANPTICKEKYFADGGVDMVVMVPLNAGLVEAALTGLGSKAAAAQSKYSGVIVDASGVSFSPALAPRILSGKGEVLFSHEMVKADAFRSKGIAAYAPTVDAAKSSGRAGGNPLIVKAANLGRFSPSDAVVGDDGWAGLNGGPAFLADAAVVFVVPPPKPLDCKGMAAGVKTVKLDLGANMILARGKGKVDFDKKASDDVRMRALERAAEVDAYRVLTEAIMKVKLDGAKTLADDPRAMQAAQGLVRNAARCDARFFKDGTAEVVLAIPIDRVVTPLAFQDAGKDAEGSPAPAAAKFTGIIVDAATAKKFAPIFSPRLLGPDGKQLYAAASVSRGFLKDYGAAAYARDVAGAKALARAGSNPLVIKAADGDMSDLKLDAAAAQSLSDPGSVGSLLEQGRVVIVTTAAAGN